MCHKYDVHFTPLQSEFSVIESEPTHPVLRKQRSLELGARPPQHRPPRASKWTKVKRAFLTSASASVPSSPNRHSAFFTDAGECCVVLNTLLKVCLHSATIESDGIWQHPAKLECFKLILTQTCANFLRYVLLWLHPIKIGAFGIMRLIEIFECIMTNKYYH